MEPLDVYVLGAGASYVHGAPLTDGLIPYALSEAGDGGDERFKLVRGFLKNAFHFTPPVSHNDPSWKYCPGLVDLLSVVDMALDRKESLVRGFDQDRLRKLRRALEYSIFRALEHSLSGQNPTHRRSTATKRLVRALSPQSSVIISFNYDVIVDIALALRTDDTFQFERADHEMLTAVKWLGIDYGLEFANLQRDPQPTDRFRLLKLHGSFNWMMSALTGNLYYGGLQKAASALFNDEPSQRVADLYEFFGHLDEAVLDLEPILITPTHLKDLRNHHLAILWREAEQALRRARTITFIGYSLPGDDLHIKYLFKHAMETRYRKARPKIIVVDYHDPARSKESQVERNYRRFFGDIEFHGEGFDAYVNGFVT
jgi:hypothetical protein